MNQIGKLVNCMYDYQRIHNIKNMCSINTVIVADHMKALNIPHKIVVGFVICNMKYEDSNLVMEPLMEAIKNETRPAINVHCWIKITDTKIIDPSWDMHSKKEITYFNTISELKETEVIKNYIKYFPQMYKQLITHYIDFSKSVDKFYDSGNIGQNEKYYYDIMKYYQQRCKYNKCKYNKIMLQKN